MKIKLSALIACGLLFTASCSFSQTSGANSSAVKAINEQSKINVLVVYYSVTGNTEKMAKAVVEVKQVGKNR